MITESLSCHQKGSLKWFTRVTAPFLHKTSVSDLIHPEGKRHLRIAHVSHLVWRVESSFSFIPKSGEVWKGSNGQEYTG